MIRDRKPRQRQVDLAIAATLAMGSFLLYLLTLAPTVLSADSGEFQFASYVLGLVHPTGYPLYLLLAKLFTYLPAGDIAYRVNLMSAFWAALTVGALYLLGLRTLQRAATDPANSVDHPNVGAGFTPAGAGWQPTKTSPQSLGDFPSRISAAVAAGAFAVSETFWTQSVVAEVYTLNAFFVVLTLLILVSWRSAASGPTGERCRRFYPLVLLFTFGLSLAHHRSMLLLIPAYTLYLWVTRDPHWRKQLSAVSPGRWVLHSAAVTLPLLLYLYIPLRAPESAYLNLDIGSGRALSLYNNDLSGFIDMVSGRVFSSKLEAGTEAMLERRGELYLGLAQKQFGPIGIALSVVGALWTLWRRRSVFLLLAFAYLSTVVFGLVYRIGDIFVYFIPAHMVLALWIGFGSCVLLSSIIAVSDRAGSTGGRPTLASLLPYGVAALSVALASGLIGSLLLSNYTQVDMSQANGIRAQWERILSGNVGQGAILVSDDRDDMVPLWYMQQVENKRTDLIGLFPGIVASPDYADVVRTIESVGDTKKPIYLIKALDGLRVRYDLQPAGPLYRVWGEPSGPGDYRSVQADFGQQLRLLDYGWSPASSQSKKLPVTAPGDTTEVTVRWKVLADMDKDYRTFVHVLDDRGVAVAQSDVTPGGDVYPTSRWVQGELLYDRHQLTLPSGLAPGFYEMRAGLYDAVSLANLPAKGGEGSVVIGRLYVRPSQGLPQPQQQVRAVFGKSIRLIGYDWQAENVVAGADGPSIRPGRPFKLTLYWETLSAVPVDYTVFVHVVDLGGKIAAQSDGMPQSGKAPTSEWPVGETIIDARSIDLQSTFAPGRYQILAGLYDAKSGQRLPIDTGADSISLLGFRVPP